MGRYLSIPILGLAAALSASIIPQFAYLNGRLSLVMLLVLAWAIRSDLEGSFAWAFVGGIMLDLMSSIPLGTSSLAMILIVFVVNTISQQVYRVNVLMILALTIFATFFNQFVIYLILVMRGNSYNLVNLIRLMLIPTIIFNLIFILPIYLVVRIIQRRLERGLQTM